jgi:hypothetical protein
VEARLRPGWTVVEATTLAEGEREALQQPTLDNLVHYARFPTATTQVFMVKVYRGGDLVGLSPVIRLVKHRATDLLRPDARRWMAPILGAFSRMTTYMVDTAFLAYPWISPYLCPDSEDLPAVRDAVVAHLKGKSDADTVILTEPRSDPAWARRNGFDVISVLPFVQVDLSGASTMDAYVAGLGKKRRKNLRVARSAFEKGGGRIELHEPPLAPGLLDSLHECIRRSATYNDLCVPYVDLYNDPRAFRDQSQHALVARVDGRVCGFFGFLPGAGALHHCHGGFDHERSEEVMAYPNLINAAIEHGIARRVRWLTLGPLNNETKRRAGTHLMPMMSGLWCRGALSRLVTRKLLLERLQVYRGPPDASEEGPAGNAVEKGDGGTDGEGRGAPASVTGGTRRTQSREVGRERAPHSCLGPRQLKVAEKARAPPTVVQVGGFVPVS